MIGLHLLGEPVDLAAGGAEDNSLSDGHSGVEIAEGRELPVLLLYGDVELLNTFKGELVALDKNALRVAHELGGDLEDVVGHGSRAKHDLDVRGQVLEHVVDLVLETAGKHFIGLIEDEHLAVGEAEGVAVHHVVDTAGGTDDELHTVAKDLLVLTH